uniref:Uncharacterized protein n=1 Tax=Setaria viridis TaxID=4556 RepID=A0A4U6U6G5_SETVI|nr:hypothetical protein SEVIR_6G216400v2 [Setaria viridis]
MRIWWEYSILLMVDGWLCFKHPGEFSAVKLASKIRIHLRSLTKIAVPTNHKSYRQRFALQSRLQYNSNIASRSKVRDKWSARNANQIESSHKFCMVLYQLRSQRSPFCAGSD